MRLLADENVHGGVVTRLRAMGYRVEWVLETSPGIGDADILSRADIGETVLITFDADFGELIFKRGLPAPRAILYGRVGPIDPIAMADRIALLLTQGLPDRHMILMTRDGERLRAFPDGADNG